MKHKLLKSGGLLLAASLFSISLNAQQKSATVYYFDDNEECFGGDFHSVSPNGEYAVGFSPELTRSAYIWSRATGEVQLITGSSDNVSEAYAVSNDGTVAGNFLDENSLDKDNLRTIVPGYWKDGVWTKLPRQIETNYGSGMNGSTMSISADGKTIGGFILRSLGKFCRVMWKDGVLQPMSQEELLGQGNIAACFALDGQIMGGWAEHDDGARSPVIWENDVMTRLDGLKSPTEVYDETGEEMEWFGGMIQSISENGNYAVGYFDPSGVGMAAKPLLWTKGKGVEYIAESGIAAVVANDGTVYGSSTGYMGSAFIYKNGVMSDLTEYLKNEFNFVPGDNYAEMSVPLGVSADGKTIVGWSVNVVDMGAIMKPMIITLDDGTTNIDENQSNLLSLGSSVITNNIVINGQYESAQLYNSVGKLMLVENSSNATINVDGLGAGIYYLKVLNGTQTETFKVIKK